MGSSSRDEIVEVFDAIDADLDRLCALSFEVFTTPERLRTLERIERVARRLRAPQHELINQLRAQATTTELGGTLRCALADRLRITKSEAGRRVDEAADLGERQALTGEVLAPTLSATAAAQRQGLIGDGHVRVIRGFFANLPSGVDPCIQEHADQDLAQQARGFRPDELQKYAHRLMGWINPDGKLKDGERARKRGITIGAQQYDGMSPIRGYLTPAARATFEPVLAKLGAPAPAILTTTFRSSMRFPMTMQCAVTCVPQPSAITTVCSSGCAPCWPPGSWGATTGYPCRSWSPPACRS